MTEVERAINRWWPLSGVGLARFGKDGCWLESALEQPGSDEIVADVEAVTICASDAKMVRMGADHPLFQGRDLERDPTCLGHELALKVAAVGQNFQRTLRVGQRVGVQPDLYNGGQRSCIGVNRPGGMADQLVLGADVLQTDLGSMVFPVGADLSRAATALLEPLGCVEGAFRAWGRDEVRAGGRLFVLCADPNAGWLLDRALPSGRIDLVGIDELGWIAAGGPADTDLHHEKLDGVLDDGGPVDDCLVLGSCDPNLIGKIYDRLASTGTFTWLCPTIPSPSVVPVDLAHFHYAKLTQRGARSLRLSDAWETPIRYDYRPGGRTLLFGASGAMGRMHMMRAINASDGPRTIVGLARRHEKLAELINDLEPSAAANGRTLKGVAIDAGLNWSDELHRLAPDGFDEVIVVAPGDAAMRDAIPHLADGGLLIGFAGTKAGETVDLPLGRLVSGGISITASSGSTVQDQQRVVERTRAGELAPETLIAAVGGFAAMRDAVQAVLESRFSGKVMIMPALDWPLMSLPELFAVRPELLSLAGPRHSWSKAIEDAVL